MSGGKRYPSTIDVTEADISEAVERIMQIDGSIVVRHDLDKFCPISMAVKREYGRGQPYTHVDRVHLRRGEGSGLILRPRSNADQAKHDTTTTLFDCYVRRVKREIEPRGELPEPCSIEYDRRQGSLIEMISS